MKPETADHPETARPRTGRPLYVDLDGTLAATDLLWEALRALLRERPGSVVMGPAWLARGRVRLKAEWADRIRLPVDTLPYRPEVLDYIHQARAEGRPVVLASASPRPWVEAVAQYLGVFDDVIATDGATNLKGAAKRDAIEAHLAQLGQSDVGFEYVGDSAADVEIWRRAGRATVAGDRGALATELERAGLPIDRLDASEAAPQRGRALVRALRPHQWTKNALLLLPLLLAHRIADVDHIARVLMAIATFCGVASGTYVLNDLMDVEADRRHPRKRARPFASGALPLSSGFVLAPLLILGALAASALTLPAACTAMLLIYAVLTTAYTFSFKEVLLLDVMVLAGLYTHRILAGGVAADVTVSPWLLAFSAFFFLSLALVKRYVEISDAAQAERVLGNRRAYRHDDAPFVAAMGIASGFISVLVLCLFVNASSESSELYARPALLWALCPIMFYWIARVWFLARRDELHEDPVVFATTDPVSWIAALLMGLTIAGAAW